MASANHQEPDENNPCGVNASDDGCVSPCDPPWKKGEQCLFWYEQKFFRIPITGRDQIGTVDIGRGLFIEFRITYEHRLCLSGKQQGPLAYTVTLLPGEKVTLYHSDRYRQVTSTEQRFSVQTTFMQFLSAVHQARQTNSSEELSDNLADVKKTTSVSVGGGLAGLIGLPSGGATTQIHVSDHRLLDVTKASDEFNQSIQQSSLLTHAERSTVVSTFEDKETADITARTIENRNDCRAVTYFVRKVVELYAFSTRVSEIVYRIVAPNVPPDFHTLDDIGWLPPPIQAEITQAIKLLPKVGQVTEKPPCISLPTDGLVYDPELAHCSSCESEREEEHAIEVRKQKAAIELLELEVERRKLLIQQGKLDPFEPVAAAASGP